MKKHLFFIPILVLVLSLQSAIGLAAQVDAMQVLEKVDAYRNFKGQSFAFDLTLISQAPNKDDASFGMKALIHDSHTSLITYETPAKEKGKALLMNGRNLWFFTPKNRKPIKITPQQRLLGEASNGDVASTDFSKDYVPTILNNEAIDGNSYTVLELVAGEDSLAAYKKLHLWVSSDTYKPYKAMFFAPSGKHLKTAYYEKYETLPYLNNKLQLTEIRIVNAVQEGKSTIMRYENFQITETHASDFKPGKIKQLANQQL